MGNPEQQPERPKTITETAPQDVSNFLTNNGKHLTDAITGAFSLLTKLFKENQGDLKKTTDAFQKTDYFKQFYKKDESIKKFFELNYHTTESGRNALKQFIEKLKLQKTVEKVLFYDSLNPLRLSRTPESDFKDEFLGAAESIEETTPDRIYDYGVDISFNDLEAWAKVFAAEFPKKSSKNFAALKEGFTFTDKNFFYSAANNKTTWLTVQFTKKDNKLISRVTEEKNI